MIVAEAIALRLKQNAIAAGKTGADIYRPTIGFAGAMIFVGGVILIVSSQTLNRVLIRRAQNFGYKIRDLGNGECIEFGKRPKNSLNRFEIRMFTVRVRLYILDIIKLRENTI
jgi:hypothetical protein